MAPITTLDLPPKVSGSVYRIPALSGEVIYIPLSKSATRLVVTGEETEGTFALVSSGGSQSDPIGFHYHREAHDVFLCLQGQVNVWAGDQCRTMEPGDFASVPPGTVHQYEILGSHTEFIGLIVPGTWVDFFRFIGEPYSGPLWPMEDDRNVVEVLIPKLKAAAEQFDMVPQPHLKSFDPQPWTGDDCSLPDGALPYFLKGSKGPAYVVEGTVVRPLCLPKQSGSRFCIGSIEGSGMHARSALFQTSKTLRFTSHHAFHVVEGKVAFQIGDAAETSTTAATAATAAATGEETAKGGADEGELSQFETIFVPAHTDFSFRFVGRSAKMYAFSNGGGVVELLCKVGAPYASPILPETEISPAADIAKYAEEHKYIIA